MDYSISLNSNDDSFRAMQNISDLFQPVFAAMFTWCIETICVGLLMLQVGIVQFFLIVSYSSAGIYLHICAFSSCSERQ